MPDAESVHVQESATEPRGCDSVTPQGLTGNARLHLSTQNLAVGTVGTVDRAVSASVGCDPRSKELIMGRRRVHSTEKKRR